jgi:hypothetical protein
VPSAAGYAATAQPPRTEKIMPVYYIVIVIVTASPVRKLLKNIGIKEPGKMVYLSTINPACWGFLHDFIY